MTTTTKQPFEINANSSDEYNRILATSHLPANITPRGNDHIALTRNHCANVIRKCQPRASKFRFPLSSDSASFSAIVPSDSRNGNPDPCNVTDYMCNTEAKFLWSFLDDVAIMWRKPGWCSQRSELTKVWAVRGSNLGREIFLFAKTCRLVLRPIHPPIQWPLRFFPGGKVARARSWPFTCV